MSSEDNTSKNGSSTESQGSTEANQSEKDYGEILREKLKGKQPIPDVRVKTFPEISIRGVKSTGKGRKGKS